VKILIAAEILPPTVGGPATWIARIGPELVRQGYQIKVITFAPQGNFDDLGLDVDWIELNQDKWLRWYKYIKAVKRQARNFDIILALGNVLAGVAAVKAKKKWGIPVVLRVPGDFAWEKAQERSSQPIDLEEFYKKKFSLFIEFLKKQQIKVGHSVDWLVTNSIYQADFIKKYWGVEKSKVSVIRNFFQPKQGKDQPDREVENILLVCGRLIRLKGNSKLLHLISDWLAAKKGWKLIFVGEGPQEESLKQLVEKLGIKDKVLFAGRLAQTEVFQYYQKARAYLLYSLHEGSPNTVLEAMNFSLPIIATRRGGTEELLEKYPRGELVEWGNQEQLLAALNKLEKGGLEKGWSKEERKIFFSDFASDKILQQWQDILINMKKNK